MPPPPPVPVPLRHRNRTLDDFFADESDPPTRIVSKSQLEGRSRREAEDTTVCGAWLNGKTSRCSTPRHMDVYVAKDGMYHCCGCYAARVETLWNPDSLQKKPPGGGTTSYSQIADLTAFIDRKQHHPQPQPPIQPSPSPQQQSFAMEKTISSLMDSRIAKLEERIAKMLQEREEQQQRQWVTTSKREVPVVDPVPTVPESVLPKPTPVPPPPTTTKPKKRKSKKSEGEVQKPKRAKTTPTTTTPAPRKTSKRPKKEADKEEKQGEAVPAPPVPPSRPPVQVAKVKGEHDMFVVTANQYFTQLEQTQNRQDVPPEQIPTSVFKFAVQLVEFYSKNRKWNNQKDTTPLLATLFNDLLLISCWKHDIPIESYHLERIIGPSRTSIQDKGATTRPTANKKTGGVWRKIVAHLKSSEAMPLFNDVKLTERYIQYVCKRPGVTTPEKQSDLLTATMMYFKQIRDTTGYFQHKLNTISSPKSARKPVFYLSADSDSLYLWHTAQLLEDARQQPTRQTEIFSAFARLMQGIFCQGSFPTLLLKPHLPLIKEDPTWKACLSHLDLEYHQVTTTPILYPNLVRMLTQLVTRPVCSEDGFLKHVQERVAAPVVKELAWFKDLSKEEIQNWMFYLCSVWIEHLVQICSSSLPDDHLLMLRDQMRLAFNRDRYNEENWNQCSSDTPWNVALSLLLLLLFEYRMEYHQPDDDKKELIRNKEKMAIRWICPALMCFMFVLQLHPPSEIPLDWNCLIASGGGNSGGGDSETLQRVCPESTIRAHKRAVEIHYPQFKEWIENRMKDGPKEPQEQYTKLMARLRKPRKTKSIINKVASTESAPLVVPAPHPSS